MDSKSVVVFLFLSAIAIMCYTREPMGLKTDVPSPLVLLRHALPGKQGIKSVGESVLRGWVKISLIDGELTGLKKIQLIGLPEYGKDAVTGENLVTYIFKFPELLVQYMTLRITGLQDGHWATTFLGNKIRLVVVAGGMLMISVNRIVEIEIEELEGFDLVPNSYCRGCKKVLEHLCPGLKKRFKDFIQNEAKSAMIDMFDKFYKPHQDIPQQSGKQKN